jgi:hypothetical protein
VIAGGELLDLGLIINSENGIRLTAPLDGPDLVERCPESAEFAGPDGYTICIPETDRIELLE